MCGLPVVGLSCAIVGCVCVCAVGVPARWTGGGRCCLQEWSDATCEALDDGELSLQMTGRVMEFDVDGNMVVNYRCRPPATTRLRSCCHPTVWQPSLLRPALCRSVVGHGAAVNAMWCKRRRAGQPIGTAACCPGQLRAATPAPHAAVRARPLVPMRTVCVCERPRWHVRARVRAASERLVTLLKDSRQLVEMGMAVPDKVKKAAGDAEKYYRYGVMLKKVRRCSSTPGVGFP
jgi:hypothetical protein